MPLCWPEGTIAKLDDLLTAEGGKPTDVGFTLRQVQLGLKPEVCLLFAHKAILPQPVQCGVGLDTFMAEFGIR